MPVVSDDRLLGIVTVDDALDVLEERTEGPAWVLLVVAGAIRFWVTVDATLFTPPATSQLCSGLLPL